MDGQNEVQKVNGTWQGTPINIKKVWGGHEFTADECAKLFNDEIIEFDAVSKKTGKPYKAKGKLEKQTFTDDNGNEHEFIGFKPIFDEKPKDNAERFEGTWCNKPVKVKRVWSGHRFTDEEVQALLNNQVITFDAVSQRTGNSYKAKGKLAEQEYNGNTFIGFKPDFD